MMNGSTGSRASAGRVVVVGLDMGDASLVRDWAAKGYLPNIATLIDKGTWLDLESTAGVLHTSTWPTFATGENPGKHGVYYPYQPSPGHQEAQLIGPDQYGVPTFWSRASRSGFNAVVYDVPETFPEDDYKGNAIFEWGTWAWYGTRQSQPDSLLADLKQRFGNYPMKLEAKRLGLQFPDPHKLERLLLKSIKHKQETFEWLMRERDWDLAVTVFGETHPAGHYLWPKSVGRRPDTEDAGFGPMRRVYEAIDKAVGNLADNLPDDAALLLVSGDGAMTNNCGWHLVPDLLTELGYSAVPDENADGGERRGLSLAAIKNLLPKKVVRLIADSLPWWLRDKIGASMSAAKIDWSKSRAFALPTDLEGCIRINLRGREPQGIVEPGAEYDELCRSIVRDMKALTDPATGESVVQDAWVVREQFEGPMVDHLPDITVTWKNDRPISALSVNGKNIVAGESPDPRTGTHAPRGFAIACGRQFPAGAVSDGRLVDVAPTILSLLSQDAAGLDGRPFDTVFANQE